MSKDSEEFKQILNGSYVWPDIFPFKFIVLPEYVDDLKAILNTENVVLKPSKTGKYISVSADIMIHNSQEVLDIYEKIKAIKDIIAL